ncbi:uncharacterized protein J8A68_005557 [[Candida] subhashii]|uniref:Glycosyl hydrolase n=1 Tax=[Candida] subhashii TaxID=561895 RepID=A0A8J5QCC0_9ASCO|nr:uncharacterized protein J8A68_005557 [[Candida] subhashii]KAG7660882.1 hypothetical protein J8A68_005557 [[Candida] subhashii]
MTKEEDESSEAKYSIVEFLNDHQQSPHNTRDTTFPSCVRLETDSTTGDFYDPITKRKVTLKGINVDSAMKYPTSPSMPSYTGSANDPNSIFFDGDSVSFVGRPFPITEARSHFKRIKSWGYNTIRYLITWEAIEHAGPGIYDEEFIEYTIEILTILGEVGGMYVFLEFHQDVWSRYCGGSGAPMWTLYAAGLEPKRFAITEAAVLHNETRFHDSSDTYHKMLWTSNYKRLATMVMFTLFFAGKTYFPQMTINGESIQDFLEGHYLNSVKHIWEAICKQLPELITNGTILGFESMNEPNCGLIGHPHLGQIPSYQNLRVGTTPTAFQAMKLGMGFPCEVDDYRISITGPSKVGTRLVDPRGVRAWLTVEEAVTIDKRYGFVRNPDWKLGQCIFANIGIWKWSPFLDFQGLQQLSEKTRLQSNLQCKLIEPHYFQRLDPNYPTKSPNIIDIHYFINTYFVDHYLKFKQIIRTISPASFILLQSPVLEIPPDIKNDPRNIIDAKTVYCPHYYDGLSLMFKSWNVRYNVDTLGIMRGRYWNPIFGLVLGEKAIRNCIKRQFLEIRQECNDHLGSIPILMSETGMPFDMDNKLAFRNGEYIAQTAALDVICNALESAGMSHTFWCYTSVNTHKWGDGWNNEDFSFWSKNDRMERVEDSDTLGVMRNNEYDMRGRMSMVPKKVKKDGGIKRKLRLKRTGSRMSELSVESNNVNKDGDSDYESSDTTITTTAASFNDVGVITTMPEYTTSQHYKRCHPSVDGVRAVSAVIRPYCIATRGEILNSEFDLKSKKFQLRLKLKSGDFNTYPTVIFVPKWHYPTLKSGEVYSTSGYVKYNPESEILEWYHDMKEDNLRGGDHEECIMIRNNSTANGFNITEILPCSIM